MLDNKQTAIRVLGIIILMVALISWITGRGHEWVALLVTSAGLSIVLVGTASLTYRLWRRIKIWRALRTWRRMQAHRETINVVHGRFWK